MAGRINIEQWFDRHPWRGPASAVEDCVVCGHLPEADRSMYRDLINTMPRQDEFGIECQKAFWRHLGLLDLFTGRSPKH